MNLCSLFWKLALLLSVGAVSVVAQPLPRRAIVVCPTSFRSALQPWCEFRESQGIQLEFVVPESTAAKTRDAILQAKANQDITAVVLVGDAPAYLQGEKPPSKSTPIPTFYHPAKANVPFGSEPEIAADDRYARLVNDDKRRVAIGRFPVQTSQQLENLVTRIIEYETRFANSMGKRQVHFVAGVGGFGPLVDGLLDTATRRLIGDGIPGSLNVSMTYARWQSPFCPTPSDFSQFTIDRLNQGGLFWVYIGHGSRYQLDALKVPGFQPLPIYRQPDVQKVEMRGIPPICVFLSCYSGAFDSPHASVGEQMLLAEKGPVAVLAATRVTMPYAMSLMADSMLRQTFVHRRDTLGEIVMLAKQELVSHQGGSANRVLLDRVAAAVSPSADLLDEERNEHALMFHLLGDPLLRINYPLGMRVKCPAIISNGHSLTVQFNSPISGTCAVELVTQRGIQREQPESRQLAKAESPQWNRLTTEYQAANDPVWVSKRVVISKGDQTVEVPVSGVRTGLQVVRVVVQGKSQIAIGSTQVFVK
ncbi:MAG: C25 family cysteine peptidase [Planctomycetota bacterium]|nr:C25 family cysteine peptidase [Planctomycetota bacterium]